MKRTLRTGLVQQRCTKDLRATREHTLTAIREAAGKGAELVVLQELHGAPYFCQEENTAHFDLAETMPGPSTDLFGRAAQECGVVLVSSVFERRAAGLYHNTSVVLEKDGTLAGIYRKMHIPDDPSYYEKFYFTPGDTGFTPIKTTVGSLGVMICWDQWYPEAARLMALAGADLLIYPAAIGWEPGDPMDEQQRQLDAWMAVQRGHAVANGLPVVTVNRVGYEQSPAGTGGQLFWGNSFALGPQGELLAHASGEQEETLVVDIDLARTEEVRRMWPFLRDRRIDAYGDLVKRYIG